VVERGQTTNAVDAMLTEPATKKHNPRFVFATDGDDVYCRDRKLYQAIDVGLKRLNDQFLCFLPLAKIERYEAPSENPADITTPLFPSFVRDDHSFGHTCNACWPNSRCRAVRSSDLSVLVKRGPFSTQMCTWC
jgi:hypothetical protein